MMKSEFETMIGKEVTVETFELYNAMYTALPERINKQHFVKMLNIDAIPESPEAIARKEERARFIAQIKQEIAKLKEEYEEENNEWERTYYPAYSARRRKEIKAEIAQLKSLIR